MQTALIIILAVLVVLLAFLLVVRTRRERRLASGLGREDLDKFESLVKMAVLDGDIQAAATHLTGILRDKFGFQKIIFLRRHGRQLDLSYYYGLTECKRRALQLRYTGGLVEVLRARIMPDTIDHLAEVLPRKVMDSLRQCGCDFYFPILWRDRKRGRFWK